ncbi:hypothetical protein FQN60_013758 [Etheostoma spectabile]|uniref:Uncharacterized protein n=1 Tax=Etheostoma spectabile TaxID=54343 RepID=A0A5J5CKG0_9PERO|nr:hypothetical protein FQN60_013758 [Etheostoma spectabile]
MSSHWQPHKACPETDDSATKTTQVAGCRPPGAEKLGHTKISGRHHREKSLETGEEREEIMRGVFFPPSMVSITSPSHRIHWSAYFTQHFPPFLCPGLTSSVLLPYINCSSPVSACAIWVQACLVGALHVQRKA